MAGKTLPPEPKASRPYVEGYGIPKNMKGALPWSFVGERMANSKTLFSRRGKVLREAAEDALRAFVASPVL